ncbi:hypothetical protein J4210_04875 [Candidatus Woesearchaeota archaeon]|nr:hypothetical protein [Candidatus Woesearchaeota archaeon]
MTLDLLIGMDNARDAFTGLQLGFSNTANESPAPECAPCPDSKSAGVQLGFLNFNKGAFRGVQIGGIDFSEDSSPFYGLQLGIVCWAREGTYAQIGLLTLRNDGPWYSRFSPFFGYHR